MSPFATTTLDGTQAATRPIRDWQFAVRHLPELLAPAGDWECVKAAVENGADAIYFGLEKFNARMRARNFTESDLPPLVEFLHRRGVRGYVTFNTLVFQNELSEAERQLRAIIAAGVDAAIVQDVGVCRLIRALSPDFPIHASTQMTITSAAGVEFARALGCNLVVLARECSIKEIARIAGGGGPAASASVIRDPSAAAAARESDPSRFTAASSLPLEVFVHGALCVAYSGQCLTSEALGGRSANRGECAQACRLPYDLIADGRLLPLGDRRYLLSPQDLVGLELLPDLIEAGVASLKIEGRLKTADYVANITRVYRRSLDRLFDEMNTHGGTNSTEAAPDRVAHLACALKDQSQYEIEMVFSRGLHTGWLRGINNQELVHGRFGKKRGVYLGEITRVQGGKVFVHLTAPLKPGDGVVFDAGHPEQEEEGGRVFEVQPLPSQVQAVREAALSFGRGAVNLRRVHVGAKVWKTSDPELERRLRQSFAGEAPHFRRPIDFEAHGRAGQALRLVARDELRHVVELTSAMPLAAAQTRPLNNETLRDQFARLGGTPFKLRTLKNHLEGAVILPVSELNRLRREAVQRLATLRARPQRWILAGQTDISPVPSVFQDVASPLRTERTPVLPCLIVLVRSLPQLEAALRCGVTTLYCDFENPKRYRDAVELARKAAGGADEFISIWLAPPRIFKPGEEWILQQVRAADADGYLVRNYDHLQYFADGRRIGDFSLNVANALAADYFRNRCGLERLTTSYDLNAAQLESLLQAAPPEWFEVTIHQHMPMFHMEHCVFCAFLSNGTDYTNCGRPCDKHEVRLRDRAGAEHVVRADIGCRNTVFNARAQTGAEHVPRLLALGVRRFRVEFVDETPERVAQIIAKYRALLRGEITGAQLWRELKLLNQLGVTRGPLNKK